MSTSPRMSVVFTAPQMKFLKDEANRLGVSVADLIRRIVDEYRDRKART